ncbi:MAG: DUF1559 domain-containing protein, partial [Planctomycetaceae bacterium]|nr:DUF1559 domain-containing protein [Planctomycetaceae bacterium]
TNQAAGNTADRNNLKQISLGMFNYINAYRRLPQPPPDGALLSWRVSLLPYLDAQDLYRQFKLDERWDSPHNKALIPQMPEVFKDARITEPGKTTYRAIAGPGTPLFNLGLYECELHFQLLESAIRPNTNYSVRVRVKTKANTETRHQYSFSGQDLKKLNGVLKLTFHGLPDPAPIGLREITDGTSNTILVVQSGVDKADFWTKPDGLPLVLNNPLPALGQVPDEGFLALFADGQVRMIPKTLPPDLLLRLFQFNDGQPVPKF